ncbi:hypothetical protein GW17_00016308 [Ensete ventricosum]|nr:hypothetical protein GW17_00016308 [Ensete ventricosum]RZR87253.1 hypothetical protein BHM03_00014636 [Ensete ventricosum]
MYFDRLPLLSTGSTSHGVFPSSRFYFSFRCFARDLRWRAISLSAYASHCRVVWGRERERRSRGQRRAVMVADRATVALPRHCLDSEVHVNCFRAPIALHQLFFPLSRLSSSLFFFFFFFFCRAACFNDSKGS